MVNIPCDYCGRPVSTIVDSEGNCSCVDCYKQFDTCIMCCNGNTCAFETDPSPIPKVVTQTMRQGPMVMQTQVKNPERVKQFCFPCKCFNQDELLCGKEDRWCSSYNEITPRFRQQRFETI